MIESSKMDNLDIILYAAMPYTGKNEIEKFNAIDSSIELSTRAERRIRHRLQQRQRYYERHEVFHPITECLKRVAVIVLIIVSISFVGVLNIEAVRNEIYNAIIEWFDESLNIKFKDNVSEAVPTEILDYREPVLSNEFARYEIIKSKYMYSLEYESSDVLIVYAQYVANEFESLLSNNDTITEDIDIGIYKGIVAWYTSENVKTTTIIWKDDKYAYSLSGNLACEELIEIAEKIK